MEALRNAHGRRIAARIALAALLAGPAGVRAESARDAEALAHAGRCAEALPGLAALRAAQPSGERTLLEAQCLIRLRRHAEAAPLLEALVEREPALAEAWLHLGIARFHLGDAAGAEAALAAAAPLAGRPEARLYRGLVLLARGDAEGAARGLDEIAEGSAAPIAAYWAGVAWLRAGDDARGREALRRVAAAAPGSSWAEQADALLRGAAAERVRPWWIRVTAGYEYDDNVILRAGDAPLAREVSSQRDTRTMWRAEAGSEWWRSGAWSSGVWLNYSGTAHDDLGALDVQLPTLGLWLDRRTDSATTLRLAYDFGWAFVDEESFLQSHGATASAIRSFGRLGVSQLFGRFYTYDYKVNDADVPDGRGVALSLCPSPFAFVCGAAGVDESDARDRDGYGTAAGVLHSVPLPVLWSELSLGYTYYRYWAEGEEQSYAAHELRLGTRSALPFGLELRVDASYAYRPYRRASSVPEPFALYLNREYPTRGRHRRDEVVRVEVGLERRIADRVRIGVLYSYLDADSNYSLFDYDRQIVGSYLTVGLGPGEVGPMTRFYVTIAALAALLGSGPARALDVLEGLAPADFRTRDLALTELRLSEGAAPLDPADWIPAANPEAGSRGGTTLTELGIPSIAAEVVESDDALGSALGHASPADLRILATPGLRETLADALGEDDLGSLGDLLDDAADGDLGGVLDEVLDGGLLEDVPLDQLPVDELVDVIEDLVPGLLDVPGGLLGGLGSRP